MSFRFYGIRMCSTILYPQDRILKLSVSEDIALILWRLRICAFQGPRVSLQFSIEQLSQSRPMSGNCFFR